MVIRLLGTALSIVCMAAAQGPATTAAQEPAPAVSGSRSAALQAELKHLAATAQSLQHNLPDFTCTETATSQAIKKNKRDPRKDKVKAQVRFVAQVRAERGEDGRLDESLNVTEVNGKPPSGRGFGRGFDPPVLVDGGFDQSLDFFLPARQACFNFTLSHFTPGRFTQSRFAQNTGRIDFDSPPGAFGRPQCREMGAPSGFVLFDAAGDPVHLERTIPPGYALQAHIVDFTSVDFSPAELDGRVYPLPARMVADVPKPGETLHFEAAYSGCRLFKATTTILPGVTPVPGGVPSASHP